MLDSYTARSYAAIPQLGDAVRHTLPQLHQTRIWWRPKPYHDVSVNEIAPFIFRIGREGAIISNFNVGALTGYKSTVIALDRNFED